MNRIFTSVLLFAIGISFLFPTTILGQHTAGFHIQYQPKGVGSPRSAIGVSMELFSQDVLRSPILEGRFGLHLDVLGMGCEGGDILIDIGNGIEEEWTVSNTQIGLNGIGRLMAPLGGFAKPYVDVIWGMGLYMIEEEVRIPEYDEEDCWIVSTNWRPRGGAGAGVMFRVSDIVDIDARVSYIYVGRVNMADLESVNFSEQVLDYSIRRATVQPLSVQLGVNVSVGE